MSQDTLQRARELINERRYGEARAILLTIPNDPTAQKWLKKLDALGASPSLDQGKGGGGRITQGVTLVMVLLTFGIVTYGLIVKPALASSGAAVQSGSWEYLTVQYNQNVYVGVLGELVQSSSPDYDRALFGNLMCAYVDQVNEELIFSYGGLSQDDVQRVKQSYQVECGDKYRGLAHYLNLWGGDRWELVSVVDKSTSAEYRIELVFKRPR